mmetsp:Transcript_31615/g.60957  ORF Transcript_31615/g.60957 Transcript_31615/m.60957 type:complete len:115 (-) Transcript_31615:50-394(-)
MFSDRSRGPYTILCPTDQAVLDFVKGLSSLPTPVVSAAATTTNGSYTLQDGSEHVQDAEAILDGSETQQHVNDLSVVSGTTYAFILNIECILVCCGTHAFQSIFYYSSNSVKCE